MRTKYPVPLIPSSRYLVRFYTLLNPLNQAFENTRWIQSYIRPTVIHPWSFEMPEIVMYLCISVHHPFKVRPRIFEGMIESSCSYIVRLIFNIDFEKRLNTY